MRYGRAVLDEFIGGVVVACDAVCVVNIHIIVVRRPVKTYNTVAADGGDQILLERRIKNKNNLFRWNGTKADLCLGVNVKHLVCSPCDARLRRKTQIAVRLIVVPEHVLQRAHGIRISRHRGVCNRLTHEKARAHVGDVLAIIRDDLVVGRADRALLFCKDLVLTGIVVLELQHMRHEIPLMPLQNIRNILRVEHLLCGVYPHNPKSSLLNRCLRSTTS